MLRRIVAKIGRVTKLSNFVQFICGIAPVSKRAQTRLFEEQTWFIQQANDSHVALSLLRMEACEKPIASTSSQHQTISL